MILEGKTLVLSGVGTGLGKRVAEAALRDGAKVFLGARTESTLSSVASDLDSTGERVGYATVDIRDRERCEGCAGAAGERFGRIDALVNLAALDTAFGGLEDTDVDDWRPVFETNVFGSLQLTKAFVPHFRSAGGGSIVFIGAQAAYKPTTPQMAYASSKAALRTATFYLAGELGGDGIRVNTVVPTWMWGAPVEGYLQAQSAERGVPVETLVAEITAGMALDEIPTEADVAESVIFFASDRARMITGQSLLVNAGELLV